MTDLAYLPPSTTMTVDQALDAAKHCDMKNVIAIGYDADGDFVLRSSRMTREQALWIIESARLWILNQLASISDGQEN